MSTCRTALLEKMPKIQTKNDDLQPMTNGEVPVSDVPTKKELIEEKQSPPKEVFYLFVACLFL